MASRWKTALEKVSPAVVCLHYYQASSFDGDKRSAGQATGFVVDSERGFILSNRHVLGPGPKTIYCLFDNHEEVKGLVIYTDPIHDFGIVQINPSDLCHQHLKALELRPDLAQPGLEIRVVGNDAGERRSILSGTISRTDRNPPVFQYYRDINTNYLITSASASGGSSGSPAVDIDGHVIAMVAGGMNNAATNMLTPVDLAARALKCLQEGNTVTRGTIQCRFLLRPYSECRNLGLQPEEEARAREADSQASGLPVVDFVLPGGPSDKMLKAGDILMEIDGLPATRLALLGQCWNDSIGQKSGMSLRRGTETFSAQVEVRDLDDLTPDRFVKAPFGVVHNMTYKLAMHYNLPCEGVVVCNHDNNRRHTLITSFNGQRVENLESFIAAAQAITDNPNPNLMHRFLEDVNTLQHNSVCFGIASTHATMDLWVRNPRTFLWDRQEIRKLDVQVPRKPQKGDFRDMSKLGPAVATLAPSVVNIICYFMESIDGVGRAHAAGFGLVIDAAMGMVVVARTVVPVFMCDVWLTIASSIIVKANIIELHPDFAIVQYDHALVDAPVVAMQFSHQPLTPGAETRFVGFRQDSFVDCPTTVADISLFRAQSNKAPRYRPVNIDSIRINTDLADSFYDGILVDENGKLQGLWMTYKNDEAKSHSLCIASNIIESRLGRGARREEKFRALPFEADSISLAEARNQGLPESDIVALSPYTATAICVGRLTALADQQTTDLQEGDIFVTLDDDLVTSLSRLDVRLKESVRAKLIRDRGELVVTIPTFVPEDLETDSVILLGGATIQKPHIAVRQQVQKLFSGVYISHVHTASPCGLFNLMSAQFITQVNQNPTPNFTSFIREMKMHSKMDYSKVIFHCIDLDGLESVVPVCLDNIEYPIVQFESGSWCKWS